MKCDFFACQWNEDGSCGLGEQVYINEFGLCAVSRELKVHPKRGPIPPDVYERIQEDLRRKLNSTTPRQNGFRDGIRAAMSIIHNVQKHIR